MENREKDKQNKGNTAEFGKNVGRAENLEGGNMRNRNEEKPSNIGNSSGSEVNETSRRPGSSYDSSSGRSGSTGSMGNKNSGSDRMRDDHELSRDDLGRGSE